MEQREVADVSYLRRTQLPDDLVIEAVEVEVGEELARQVADRQAAAAGVGGEEIVAWKV